MTVSMRLAVGAVLCATAATAAAQTNLSILEAARITLLEQPSIRFQREQVTAAEGVLQAASGRFDMQVGGAVDRSRSATPLRLQDQPASLTTAVANQTRYTVGLDKPLRSGLIISPSIGVTRQDLAYDPLATNRAAVSFGVTQPLMRGRGNRRRVSTSAPRRTLSGRRRRSACSRPRSPIGTTWRRPATSR
jgi:hypothetical protein